MGFGFSCQENEKDLTIVKINIHNSNVNRKAIAFPIISVIIFFTVFTSSVKAAPQIPPTAEGPGFILPDSPLFFLDELKQNIRLTIAFTPQDKAKTYNAIAGERLAELRYMLARNNKQGIEKDLLAISYNQKKASDSLEEAKFNGENVEKIAEKINIDVNRRQDAISELALSSEGELKTMVLGVQTSLYESKAKVAGGLPGYKVDNEIKTDLMKQISNDIGLASSSSRELLKKLEALKKKTTEISDKDYKKIEEDLRKAEKDANKDLVKLKRDLLTNEKRKQEAIARAYRRLEEAARKVEQAGSEYARAKQELERLLNLKSGDNPATPTPIPSSVPRI